MTYSEPSQTVQFAAHPCRNVDYLSNGCNKELNGLRGSATAGLNGIYTALNALSLESLSLHTFVLSKCRLTPAELCKNIVIQLYNHKRFGVLCTGIVGLILLICISLFGHDLLSETVEIVLTELASLIIICAHVMNYQLRPTKICNSQEQIATKP